MRFPAPDTPVVWTAPGAPLGRGFGRHTPVPTGSGQEPVKWQCPPPPPPEAAFAVSSLNSADGAGEEVGDRKPSLNSAHLHREGAGCLPFLSLPPRKLPLPSPSREGLRILLSASEAICITHLHLKGAHRLATLEASVFYNGN